MDGQDDPFQGFCVASIDSFTNSTSSHHIAVLASGVNCAVLPYPYFVATVTRPRWRYPLLSRLEHNHHISMRSHEVNELQSRSSQ